MKKQIRTCDQLVEYIHEIGFLPLLKMGYGGWSAEEVVDRSCQYQKLPNGSYEWKLWKWKGTVLQESGCAYGRFFGGNAGFISHEWWLDFCNWRRSRFPLPAEDSIEGLILQTLQDSGSMVTRQLRAACGFVGPKMRGKFSTYVSHLEMACRIVTEDFVYPIDKEGKEYGWGWSLLTTPEQRFGNYDCQAKRSPEESYNRLKSHFHKILPTFPDMLIASILR